VVLTGTSMGGQQSLVTEDAWLHRSEEVLATIVHGGRFIPYEGLTRPGWSESSPRATVGR
jgi:hypothetical protein